MRASALRRLRPWVQALAFILFVVALVVAGRVAFLPADLFFRLDPLAGLAGMLAARRVVPAMLVGGLVTLALTVVAGRVWCGWLCPLGTVLDWVPAHKPAPKEADLDRRWRQVKYFLLALILLAAALGNLSLIFLDPSAGKAQGPRRLCELPFLQSQDLSSDQPGRERPLGKGQSHNHHEEIRWEQRDYGEQKDQAGKRHDQVDEPHQD